MKAAVFHAPRDIRVETVPDPQPGPGEVLIRVHRCAVCGTDFRIFCHGQKNVTPPAITGHEISGVVEALGEGVRGVEVGTRVILATVVGCGECHYCRNEWYNLCESFTALGYEHAGGFAEKMVVPAQPVRQGNVIPIPDNVSFDEGAVVEPLSCCLNGQSYLKPQAGDRALVFGAGPIGLMNAELFRAAECDPVVVVDPVADRLKYVTQFELGTPFHPRSENVVDEVLKFTKGEKFDVALCACSAKQAQLDALRLVRKKARVSFFAGIPKDDPIIPFDSNLIHYQEISVFGAFASHLSEYHAALDLVASGRINLKKFVSHVIPLDEINRAYEVIEKREAIKVVIDCSSASAK